jgi:hypothetical protein
MEGPPQSPNFIQHVMRVRGRELFDELKTSVHELCFSRFENIVTVELDEGGKCT